MTTHDKPSSAATTGDKRIKRPKLDREDAIRSGTAAAAAAKAAGCEEDDSSSARSGARDHRDDPATDDAVAQAVRSSYDTLAETIAQGRQAADRFRQGQYNMREVPVDVEKMLLRLLELARQLSGATFDICEQLVHQLSTAATVPEPGETPVPPFRDHTQAGTRTASPSSGSIPLSVQFEGDLKRASSPTNSLSRPAKPTRPEEITVSPLLERSGKGKPIEQVELSFDASIMGLVAGVVIPAGHPPGVYVGFVVSDHQAEPLGMLVVTVTE